MATRCTEYTLNAFGIEGEVPKDGVGMITAFRRHGYTLNSLGEEDYEGKTVRTFLRNQPEGEYYISTAGHAMAVRDGELYDYAGRGADLRRIKTVTEVIDDGRGKHYMIGMAPPVNSRM